VAAGVPLTGPFTVTPRRAVRPRGAWVELLLDEHVPARADVQALRWVLRAALDRTLHADPQATMELAGTTAP
jgi:hypothetical protein